MKISSLFLLLSTLSLFAFPPLTSPQESHVDSLITNKFPRASTAQLVPLVDTMISSGEYSDAILLAQYLYSKTKNTQNRFSLLMSIAGASLVQDDSLLIKAYIRSKNIKHYEMYYGSKAESNTQLMALTDTLTRNCIYYITNDLWSSRRDAYDSYTSLFWSLGKLEKRNNPGDSTFISTMNSIIMDVDTLLRINMVDSTLSYCDNAVALLRKSRSQAFEQEIAQRFFPFEQEIARYALEKDSLDIIMGLFSVLAPLNQTNTQSTTKKSNWEKYYASSRSLFSERNINERLLTKELLQERYVLAEKLYARDNTSETLQYFMIQLLNGMQENDKAFALAQKLTATMDTKSERWFYLKENELNRSYSRGNADSAITVFEQMHLEQPEQIENSINFFVPDAYLMLKQPEKAYSYYYETIQIGRWLNGKELPWSLGSSLSWISLLSQNHEQVKRIENHYDEGLFRNQSNDTTQIKADSLTYAMTLANIGHSYAQELNKREALSYYKQAKKIFKRNHHEGKKGGIKLFTDSMIDDYKVMAEYGITLKKQRYFFRKLRVKTKRS